ncbi:hypothetical protein [Trichloromonas sp.]|uniref:hypothetical protein n=1 Tax=Trichloromonas sp. TaxID=3069249 RepID=UPI002A46D674|nr:hypothetical protein [Trichloromonas sp.]
MLQAQALVDYERFGCAKVALFVDTTEARRTAEVLVAHGPVIRRVAELFAARILLVDKDRLRPETIIDQGIADAWLLLVTEGRNRAMTTKKNPQRINLDGGDWERHAFLEILRQIKESTRIQEEVTGSYRRYTPERTATASLVPTLGPN